MARGTVRSPSTNAYRGALGRTQTRPVHVTGPGGELIAWQVYTTVDAVSDPELAERLQGDEARALNVVRLDGIEPIRVHEPVIYHDPAAELFVLVLGEAHRHRELEERIAVLERLRADGAAVPVYVKDHAVVYGAAGLRAFVEARAQAALEEARAAEAGAAQEKRAAEVKREQDRRAHELAAAMLELDSTRSEIEGAKAELAGRTAELARERAELARERAELDRMRSDVRNRVIAAAQESRKDESTAVAPAPLVARLAEESGATVQVPHAALLGGDGDSNTFERAEPELLSMPPARARRETDDVITGSQVALNGHVNGVIPLTMPAPAGEAPESFEVDVDTGVVAAAEVLRAGEDEVSAAVDALEAGDLPPPPDAFPLPMAPEAAETVPGGPDARESFAAAAAPKPWTEPDDETTGAAAIPQGADPLTTETVEVGADAAPDPWLEKAMAAGASAFTVEAGAVRLALFAGEALAKGLTGKLDVRVLLHRTPAYPIVTVVVGPPAALRVPSAGQLAVLVLDIANDRDRAVLAALGRRFELVIDLVVHGARVRRVKLVAPLAENVGYILRAAEDHLRGVAAEGEPALSRGRDLVLGAGYDLLGTEHVEASEFRDDKLAQLGTAQHARRAIAMARRFARPSREDYLVCTRGFPLPRWRELRRHVLETAVAWGLWMGSELAQVAVSEGLARSRRDLVVRLDRGGDVLRKHPTANDLDDGAIADNAAALADEAKALGVELSAPKAKANGAASSDDASVVVGSIGATPPHGMPAQEAPKPDGKALAKKSTDELIALLDDRVERVAAAIALCERAEARAAAPVIATVTKLSRAEAVRVLGMSVKFGEAAKAPLVEGLKSSKAFLRHGCALALGLLRTEDGTQAVIDLLMTEPTEIWREVARAIGQVGPTALLALASTFGRLGDRATPALAERVAWAMAHVAVRGGKAAIETMAGGHSVVAPVAKHALELHASAANDQVRVRGGAEGSHAGRDVTVNRAFSRRFFEALEQGLPAAAAAELEALDASSPMELLDESDLIEDEEEEIEEADLIQ